MHEIAPSACWPTPSCLRDDVFERRKLFVRRRLLRGVPQWERVAAVFLHGDCVKIEGPKLIGPVSEKQSRRAEFRVFYRCALW